MNIWQFCIIGLIFFSFIPSFLHEDTVPVYAQDVSADRISFLTKAKWPPGGTPTRCIVTRDTLISAIREEANGNNGAMDRLKIKSQQEFVLFDIDPTPLKGKIVAGAILHVRSASPREAPLTRIGVSTVSSPWEEGSSGQYRPQVGSACFNQAAYQKANWAYDGSTMMDVIFGRGHTIWKFADCTVPDKDGWQACAIDPDVISARVAGISHGFCVYDEVGSIWSMEKGKFTYTHFPNRFFFSREKKGSAPWLEVWTQPANFGKPGRIGSIKVRTESMPAGEAILTWNTPRHTGMKKVLGYIVTYKKDGQQKEFPRYLVPMAGSPGEEIRMHIQDVPFSANDVVVVTVLPVDSVGNKGQPFSEKVRLSAGKRVPDVPEADIEPFPLDSRLPRVGNLKVSVVDLLDKIDPRTGSIIPTQKAGYKGGNHLYSAEKKLIRLQSARNEMIAFQLNLEGAAKNISVDYAFSQDSRLKPRIYEFGYVSLTGPHGSAISIAPDPLVPLKGSFSLPSTSGVVGISGQQNHSLICELYVPHEESTGKKNGRLVIQVGDDRLDLDVELTVWNFTLPNKLSFVPEMNAYGVVSPYDGYEYYRLAHEHRTCINRVPYGWDGVPSFAPKWNGDRFNWFEWDRKVGPLLDGSAFEDLPRKSEPVDVFYLPFNENWPAHVFDHYTPSYWADEAFDEKYAKKLQEAFSLFAGHCDVNKWHDTIFQFYLNNKIYYRKNFQKSSAPWLFDEPVNTQDFWALRWYGLLWKEAVDKSKGKARMCFRGDISYSQFARDILWGIMDFEYLGDSSRQKMRMKQDEHILFGRSGFAEYGTANRLDMPNTQPALWCISAWAKGASGVLPWQTIGTNDSWKTGEQTALFYPSRNGPMPSVRLKAFTRGQQDVEYLMLFRDHFKTPQYAIAGWLNKSMDIGGRVVKSSDGDAGTPMFDKGDALELWRLRYRIGKILSEKAPQYRRSIVNLEGPKWRPTKKPRDLGYVRVAPNIERYRPVLDNSLN